MLDRENRIFGAPHSFYRLVVEVDVGHFDEIWVVICRLLRSRDSVRLWLPYQTGDL